MGITASYLPSLGHDMFAEDYILVYVGISYRSGSAE